MLHVVPIVYHARCFTMHRDLGTYLECEGHNCIWITWSFQYMVTRNSYCCAYSYHASACSSCSILAYWVRASVHWCTDALCISASGFTGIAIQTSCIVVHQSHGGELKLPNTPNYPDMNGCMFPEPSVRACIGNRSVYSQNSDRVIEKSC